MLIRHSMTQSWEGQSPVSLLDKNTYIKKKTKKTGLNNNKLCITKREGKNNFKKNDKNNLKTLKRKRIKKKKRIKKNMNKKKNIPHICLSLSLYIYIYIHIARGG